MSNERQATVISNGIAMKLAWIPPGHFLMGSPCTEADRNDNEYQHRVEITRGFHMGLYPVTQAEYRKVMGDHQSHFSSTGGGKWTLKGVDTEFFPVEMVTCYNAMEFCARLTDHEKNLGRVYDLPTEAEWEYACRAGTTTAYFVGPSLKASQANCDGQVQRTTKVGSYPPNSWGLYDMHGNVREWCKDWFRADYYYECSAKDPSGPSSGTECVKRGGSWDHVIWACRAAYRECGRPGYMNHTTGFRVVARGTL